MTGFFFLCSIIHRVYLSHQNASGLLLCILLRSFAITSSEILGNQWNCCSELLVLEGRENVCIVRRRSCAALTGTLIPNHGKRTEIDSN